MIDGDVYGPNLPIMLGVDTQLESDGKKIVPAEKFGIRQSRQGNVREISSGGIVPPDAHQILSVKARVHRGTYPDPRIPTVFRMLFLYV